MRIYIIGFMGSGKSTLGNKLANKLKYAFIDLDKRMEEMEGMSVKNIFRAKGEDYFRQIENYALLDTLRNKNAVISCGGGTPCFHNNMDWMKAHGKTIYLQMSPARLFGRLKTRKEKRPLIKNLNNAELKEYIKNKLAEREKFYLQADIITAADNLKIKDVLVTLKSIYNN